MSLRSAMKKSKSYELGIAQTLVARNTNNFRNRILKAYGLTSVEWFVLGVVQNKTPKGGIRVTDLANTLDVKTTYITATLNTLKSKGFVSSKSDAHDARVRLVITTKAGSTVATTIENHLQKEIEKCLRDKITGEQFENYVSVLWEIAQAQESDPLGHMK